MTGYQKMLEALSRSVLSRPNGLLERLVYPLARKAYEQGFRDGYGTGHIDGQYKSEETNR